ncbi:MAG: PIN domain-containing protein [Terriglobales bacterium]
MTVLVDTTVLIGVLRSDAAAQRQLQALVDADYWPATTAINVGEIHAGMHAWEEAPAQVLLNRLQVFAITPDIGRRGGALKYAWARRGRTLSLDDALIAAVALEHELPLLTDSRRDFPMPELQLWPLPRMQ